MVKKKKQVAKDRKKFLLISLIVVVLVVFTFLIFYSPVREALFGKAIGDYELANRISCTDFGLYVEADFSLGSLNYRVRRSDSCVGGQIKEYSCVGNRHKFDILNCLEGQSCNAGACVEDVPPSQGFCGDRLVQQPNSVGVDEVCDGGLLECTSGGYAGTQNCNNNCNGWNNVCNPIEFCGDRTRNGPEECDDGNFVDTDGCNSNCEVVEVPPPPPAGDANLIAFTRGIVISEVLNSIQISQGSIWVVDPDDANPNPVRLTPVESAGSIMPSWSPNKDKIVFASNRGRIANAGDPAGDLTPFLDLWTVNADGTNLRRITSQEGHDWTPAWSPDGSLIAYASTASPLELDKDNVGSLDIWVVGADGSNPRMIADNGGQDEDPVFSADGNTIYYAAANAAATEACVAIWQVGINGNGNMPVRNVVGQTICGEDPSVSGNTLYFWDNGRLYGLNFNSTGGSTGFPFGGSDDSIEPWVNRLGNRFTYIRNFINNDGSYNDGGDIYVSNIAGGEAKLVTSGQNDFFPRWS